MEQTIYFDEGKLVVETNNGRIKDGKTTAQISGEFIAKADTVAMLLSELEGHSLTMQYTSYFGWMERSGSWSLITEKEIAEEIKATKEALEELKGKLNIATKHWNFKGLEDCMNRQKPPVLRLFYRNQATGSLNPTIIALAPVLFFLALCRNMLYNALVGEGRRNHRR